MEPQDQQNAQTQNGMRDARTHINRQKGADGLEPPRTVAEQVDEMITVEDGQPRRDPIKAAQAQQTERDNGVGGAWIDTSQRANAPGVGEEVFFEKLPDRHAERADREADAPDA